jgi:hypothetical protein
VITIAAVNRIRIKIEVLKDLIRAADVLITGTVTGLDKYESVAYF